MSKRSPVAIVCGPTGGHLFPALLTAGEFIKNGWPAAVFSSVEKNSYLLKNFSGEYHQLKIENWPASSVGGKIKGIGELLRLTVSQIKNWQSFQAVIGFGGYPSLPVVLAGVLRGKPVFLHEQNCLPGKATMVFSAFAWKVFYGLPPVKRGAEDGWEIVGNPLRTVAEPVDEWFDGGKLLVVFGGSQGSREISEKLLKVGTEILDKGWKIFYLRGRFGLELDSEFSALDRFKQVEFSSSLPAILNCADCVWTRAGAGTVSELYRWNIPAILFPYKKAADSHQDYNADWLVNQGPAVLGSEMTAEQLIQSTLSLGSNKVDYDQDGRLSGAAERKIFEAVVDEL